MHKSHKLLKRPGLPAAPIFCTRSREPRALRLTQLILANLELDGKAVGAVTTWRQDEQVGLAGLHPLGLHGVRSAPAELVRGPASCPDDEQVLLVRPALAGDLQARLGPIMPLAKITSPARARVRGSKKYAQRGARKPVAAPENQRDQAEAVRQVGATQRGRCVTVCASIPTAPPWRKSAQSVR